VKCCLLLAIAIFSVAPNADAGLFGKSKKSNCTNGVCARPTITIPLEAVGKEVVKTSSTTSEEGVHSVQHSSRSVVKHKVRKVRHCRSRSRCRSCR